MDYYIDQDSRVLPLVSIPFLEGCPNLEVLDDAEIWYAAEGSWLFQHPAIFDTLRRVTGVQIRHRLQQHGPVGGGEGDPMCEQDDVDVARSISEPEGTADVVWQKIRFLSIPVIGPVTSSAIVNASSLRGFQEFTSRLSGAIPSRDIQSILQHGRSLRNLQLHYSPILLAFDVTRSLWSCKWLRMLHVKIGGISRPAVQTDYRGNPIPAGTPLHSGIIEESRAVQQRVHAQLANLECLEDLHLGWNSAKVHWEFRPPLASDKGDGDAGERDDVYYDPGLQLNCLGMSFKSGLGQLSRLSSLQYLTVCNMEHGIDIVDLGWIRKYWPLLWSVKGLVLDRKDMHLKPGRRAFFFGLILELRRSNVVSGLSRD
ncbi:hypothetical protein BGX29_008802 [Mortierella sp. GBA35]|nr:hypothetical protein BGX29_008802 [Mortierella sp. GBA35]